MKVVILCGGEGTRIREETENKPKPMIEIAGRPILWHIMKGYAQHGYKKFVLCLGYQHEYVRRYFLHFMAMNSDFTVHLDSKDGIEYHNKHDEDWTVTLVNTGPKTKKGTRIKMIEPFITEPEFMITYGDGVSNVNIKNLVDFHRNHKKMVTFTGVHPISRFATVETNGKNEVVDWNEKKALEGYMNAGFFVVNREIFQYLNEDCELEEEPMKLLAQKGEVKMYQHEGFWQCMDTYRDYKLLNDLWATKDAPWKTWKD